MKSDIPIKRILKVRPNDWVSYLLPNIEKQELTPLDSTLVPKSESRLDNINFVNNDFILHIEPNGYLDYAIPARMLRYRADIWEYTINQKLGTPLIKQVLLLFFKKHDNEKHSLTEKWDNNIVLDFNYTVIKVWQMDKNEVIEKQLIGLYPLIPLMENDKNTIPDNIIKETMQIINTVSDISLKNDLITAMAVLASEKFSKELVKKYIGREIIMESALLQDWAEEIADERTIEIAKNMLKRDRSLKEISEDTGLSLRELQILKKKLD